MGLKLAMVDTCTHQIGASRRSSPNNSKSHTAVMKIHQNNEGIGLDHAIISARSDM